MSELLEVVICRSDREGLTLVYLHHTILRLDLLA